MKVEIISYRVICEPASAATSQFGYTIEGGDASPRFDSISVQTARVLVRELEDGTAFMGMLFAIVNADPSEYPALIGQIFTH
jgi:hypothetical protein